jgi:hypothetical protein
VSGAAIVSNCSAGKTVQTGGNSMLLEEVLTRGGIVKECPRSAISCFADFQRIRFPHFCPGNYPDFLPKWS